jgi:outer membrane protein OmpA-like peptidoglycan-associated protein
VLIPKVHLKRLFKTAPFAFAAVLAVSSAGCGPEYPLCGDDDDCHESEYCVDGQCQLCRSNADCAAGQECNGGRCDPIEGFCSSETACPDGQECQNSRCVAISSQDLGLPDTGNTGNTGCQLEPIYFSFDQDGLDNSSRDIMAANVQCMRERSIARVHVTGYTDPRGTEEYNLALGDRRARGVIQYMTSLGADRNSFSGSSMGEEMSAGESEASWRLDRKVTFTER